MPIFYRFREAQAAKLGLGMRADRRPKMASACNSLLLYECTNDGHARKNFEREISELYGRINRLRSVESERRNKLLSEKRHRKNQVIACEREERCDGKKVLGTKGYKPFSHRIL
ncbi:hypothetical protein F5J12DRAFT_845629 [Pisolithus orientalis]|uniref:uncharacterized protein n=1 Tax=Pisolithus orientalis TaxID=936130 RepID=UPI002224F62D|nr:uncharacterized protein F5J12DRAFT_845629 [Pisolithus orientalis]KAI6000370.1 hypothetical protein F5J12DRAFT_845629 [Pisolithus orientalis]